MVCFVWDETFSGASYARGLIPLARRCIMFKLLHTTFWRVVFALLVSGLGSALADPGNIIGSVGR
jgi:hypothetical protein